MRNRATAFAETLLQQRRWAVLFFQAILILFSLVFAWLLRLDFSWGDRATLWAAAPVLLICRLLAIRLFRLHLGWWRYAGINDAYDIFKAVTLGSGLFFLVMEFGLRKKNFPESLYLLEALLTAGLLVGVRVLLRVFAESVREDLSSARRVLIIGAGFGAQMILREIRRPGSGYVAVGCVDDEPSKFGLKILGTPVIGNVDQVPELVSQLKVREVLIAVPSASSKQMKRFVNVCDKAEVKFRTVPALRDLLMDREPMSQVREVNLDDLLGREPVQIDLESVRNEIEGRVVMVTGAAGSIGSEICRQILDFRPQRLICLDNNETGIFYLDLELGKLANSSDLVMAVVDIQDSRMLRRVFVENAVEIVFHAAAYKHVPVMECNVHTAVKNNVLALLAMLDVAQESGCGSFILISSDKAVNPTSVMGSTKRIGEIIVASRPKGSMRCVSVRFGNVLGSNGSLVPILQEQLRNGRDLTITDPEIRRFFMTTQEAVSLVLQACVIGTHRDVLVLDMGESLRIVDIARTLIKLSGKSPNDVKIVFTGLRDGEKFYEELFYQSEEILPTSFEKIKRTKGSTTDWPELSRSLDRLQFAALNGDGDEIRERIRAIVPEYVYTRIDDFSAVAEEKLG